MTAPTETETDLTKILEKKFLPIVMRGKKKHTIAAYRRCVRSLGEFLERPATTDDLTDETVCAWLSWYHDRPSINSPRTVNNAMICLRRYWKWLFGKRMCEFSPELAALPEPPCKPKAWTPDELKRLFKAIDEEGTPMGRQPGHLWWRTIHLLILDSGERTGALYAVQWSDYNPDSGMLHVPGEIRKGGRKEANYHLRKPAMDGLRLMREIDPEAKFIFRPGCSIGTVNSRYEKILKRAGLPCTRKDKMHKMRRTFGTYVEISGGDATAALGHEDRRTTKQSYLDEELLAPLRKPLHAPLPDGIVPGWSEPSPQQKPASSQLPELPQGFLPLDLPEALPLDDLVPLMVIEPAKRKGGRKPADTSVTLEWGATQ